MIDIRIILQWNLIYVNCYSEKVFFSSSKAHIYIWCLPFSNINHRCLLSILLSYGLIKQCANLCSPHFDAAGANLKYWLEFTQMYSWKCTSTLVAKICKMAKRIINKYAWNIARGITDPGIVSITKLSLQLQSR